MSRVRKLINKAGLGILCAGEDLNLQALYRHQHLKLACLPGFTTRASSVYFKSFFNL